MAIQHLLKRTRLTQSTLAFHLDKLQKGRILQRRVRGSEVWFRVDHRPFARLKSF
jgi:DNA-binding transcriptional ArsR family regulator